ncbi:FAD-linked sulfhydryl oxidase Erv2p [Trichomonascus vanleenenianus]|uniref:flavin-linked sulfhydryl oxidase n=1 Tax=Trichomonascus vanleenenianus TaxID=2268995 RepID=UPI003ECB0AD2
MMVRRPSLTVLALVMASVFFIYFIFSSENGPSVISLRDRITGKPTTVEDLSSGGSSETPLNVKDDIVHGKPIMAKMANQTLRAELGRAGWKVFHTILAQYPEKPTQDERETLTTFIQLFSRVYPCRECAEHFQEMIKKYPPQTSTREHASQWGCHVHNIVNKRLGKPEFDCFAIANKYSCGCNEEEGAYEDAEAHDKESKEHLEGITIDQKEDAKGG